jgi:hypothetical protein
LTFGPEGAYLVGNPAGAAHHGLVLATEDSLMMVWVSLIDRDSRSGINEEVRDRSVAPDCRSA